MDTNPATEVAEGTVEDRLEALLIKSATKAEPEPEAEQETEDQTEDAPEETTDEADSEAATAEPEDSEEVEFEGEVYVMPKKLKEALLRQKDYTQKTQEVAEQRKALEQEKEFLTQQQKLMAAGFEKAVELKEIDNKLGQFKQLDWQALVDQDPAQATKLNIAFQQLQQARADKLNELQQAGREAEELTAKQRQQVLAQGMEQVKKVIPNFNAELGKAIVETVKGYGFTQKELDQLTDPRFVVALHDAHQWRKLQASKSTVTKKVADVKPVKTTARTATASQASSKLNEARQALAKTGSNDAAEAYFERLLTSRKRA